MRDFRLRLQIGGASMDDVYEGLEAADAVLKSKGIGADEASRAFFEAGNDIRELTEKEWRAVYAWGEAQEAAIEACCRNWPKERWPDYDVLAFDDDTAEQLLEIYRAAFHEVWKATDKPDATLPAVKERLDHIVTRLRELTGERLAKPGDLGEDDRDSFTKLTARPVLISGHDSRKHQEPDWFRTPHGDDPPWRGSIAAAQLSGVHDGRGCAGTAGSRRID